MPRDGSGVYTLPAGQPVVTGSVISSSVFNTLTSDIATALTDSATVATLASSAGAGSVGFLQNGIGAVASTVQNKARETVSVKDFGAVGDGVADDTAAIQLAIDNCVSATSSGARRLYIPAGRYRTSSQLVISAEFVHIEGDGQWSSIIEFTGAGGMRTSPISYLRPVFQNFGIVTTGAGSGKALDLSNVAIQVYLGEIRNMRLHSVDDGFYAPRFFSMLMDTVSSYSSAGHCFRIACGPAVTLRNLYALTCGLGKAGYRLRGSINMYGCNGLNEGDNWGVFGNDLTSADGFQGDFDDNDLPAIYLEGCNLERFGSLSVNGIAVRVQNAFRTFVSENCKLDRADLATAYKAMIYCRLGANASGEPVRLGFSTIFKGTGVPSDAHLYSPVGGCVFLDTNNAFTSAGITTYKVAALTYPLARLFVVSDIFNDTAVKANALTARRITVEMMRYRELSATPSGAGQDIDITGYTKILVTPPIVTTINRLTFSQTPGTGDDYLRNGEVIIEAMNANTTLNHNFGAANGMRLLGGANLTMALGQVVRLMRSANYLPGTVGWVQV